MPRPKNLEKPRTRTLSPKRARFVEEYPVDWNVAAAARRAGFSAKTAASMGYKCMQDPLVLAAIAAARQQLSEKLKVTQERIVEEYRRIAFADIRHVINITDGKVTVFDTNLLTPEQAAALSEISETKDGIRIKMHSKIAALDSLGKHLGMFIDRSEQKHTFDPDTPPPVIQLVPTKKKETGDA